MATYPIKMLRDEEGKPFVPLISIDSVKEIDGESLEEKLDKKLETTNLIAGTQIELEVDGNNITISNSAEGTKLIDNLEAEQAGTGALDARQGKVLLEKIPTIANNLNTPESDQALSAYQGYVLAGRVAPVGGATGQVLKKASDGDYSFEWGDAADPNAIVGDGSIMKIVELTYEEYLELEATNQLQDDTEYHINDWNENERTYLTEKDIQDIVQPLLDEKIDTSTIYTGDLNDIDETGYLFADSGAANKPEGNNNGYVFTQVLDNNYMYQSCFLAETGTYYTRIKYGGSWRSWVRREAPIIDNLTSTATTQPLSANQGRILNEKTDSIIKLFKRSLSLPAMSAGSSGYVYLDTWLPSGYSVISVNIETNQISKNSGLQLTPIYGQTGNTDSTVLYIEYYNPVANITATQNVEVWLVCCKTNLIAIEE